MANFFIDRPIFAWVLAIILMLAGIAAIFNLPVSQFPTIAPPTIQIQSRYPGASASTVENTVTQVIEQQMRGLDHLMYMSSTSDDFGQAAITLTFAPGTNPDIAQVQVQNKLQLATPQLPQTVQQTGIEVTKSNSSTLLAVGFISADGSMNRDELANYVASNIQDPVSRLDGVGQVQLYGRQFAMRIWLNPLRLNNYKLNPTDVTNAIAAQNVQIAGGSLGGTPPAPGQMLQATITEATLLRTPTEFGNILLKVEPDGSQVRVKDVARVELGGEDYNYLTLYNGKPAAAIGVQLATGANALEVAERVRDRVKELAPFAPPGVVIEYPQDTTPFVTEAITGVFHTLLEGIVLVFLIMYLFLQNFRATLIPTIAVPVVLLGTFAAMVAVGFSINTLSMFGLVLAIGLLVDDAIVVVENVERVMVEEGLGPKEATRKAMGQITGALIGVAVVLGAVFVPVAFASGSVGAIYRQFSLTIVVAMVLSVLTAVILTPALCATMLKPVGRDHQKKTGFFGWFNRIFDRGQANYHVGVQRVIRASSRYILLYVLLTGAAVFMFLRVPMGFLPDEDQGRIFVVVTTPPGATQERTSRALSDVSAYLREDEKDIVTSTWEINGYSFPGRAQTSGVIFVQMKAFEDRLGDAPRAQDLVNRLNARFADYKDANITAGNPPAIPGLGNVSGFDLELMDSGGVGHDALMRARNSVMERGNASPVVQNVRPNGLNDAPKFKVNIDREKASALGLTAAGIDQAFSVAWGSAYVNKFLDLDNRIKSVYVQADAQWRMTPENLNDWYLRNDAGEMVPFSTFGTGEWIYGSPQLERYQGVPAVQINGNAADGYSTGQAMDAMEEVLKDLPEGISYAWTGISVQERQSASQAPIMYAISIVFVFLCLAALYESWSIPVSVILVVPLGILGALAAALLRGLENDVFFQVALLTTVGLSAKNAILIVEFARDLQAQGRSAVEAAIEAARLRLRPILMTSVAFILGVLPLVFSSGAGSTSQNAIGTGVIGGMLASTFLAIFMTPLFFVLVSRLFVAKQNAHGASEVPQRTEPQSRGGQ
ncbi:efflux RND transporter permease subunit [Pseudomonas coleopterorum]|uniref:Efflux pump membrane transporter n=1 Tax=Pseudomonas coleopterorum TaxID=1605838 RepID=A0AAJ6MRK9_9PSED|nr:efflux RND transporter permease subunit [Pseudomonas coleopterorum]WNC08006.1 efflux RND transporter permease subunit [Pseudomonas coleopterorum]